jgi:hypothetical protein
MLSRKEKRMSHGRFEDPVVAEIHKVREKLLEECGGDLDKLMDRLASREREDGSRVVVDAKEVKVPVPPRS